MIKQTFLIPTGQIDANGDMLLPQAFKDLPKKAVLLNNFDAHNPIGRVEVFRDGDTIKCDAEIEIPEQLPLECLTTGIMCTVEKSHVKGDIRYIDKIKLYAVSLIPKSNQL